jgi:hypothetical protein
MNASAHAVGIDVRARPYVRFLLMRKLLSVEVVNFVVRYLRSRGLIWTDVDASLPTIIPTDRMNNFIAPLRQSMINDISCCIPDRETDPIAVKLMKMVRTGQILLPFTNPVVPVFVWDRETGQWVSRTLDLYVSDAEYTDPVISDKTLDIIMRILITVMMTSSFRASYRLYFVNQKPTGIESTVCVDLTATGQIYMQFNSDIAQMTHVKTLTLVVTRYLVSATESFVYSGFCSPADPGNMLCVCVDGCDDPRIAETPPLVFKCHDVKLYIIDPRVSDTVAGVIRRRMWWGAVLVGMLVCGNRRRLHTVARAIRQWQRIVDVDYVSHRIKMWYVFHTVLSHTAITLREKMKESVLADGLEYTPCRNFITGLLVTPYRRYDGGSHAKRNFGDYVPAIRHSQVPSGVAGIRRVDVFDIRARQTTD